MNGDAKKNNCTDYRNALLHLVKQVNDELSERHTRLKAILGAMDHFKRLGNAEHWEAYLPRLQGQEKAICTLYTKRARLVKAVYALECGRKAG